jgi:hypothetical protein
LLLFEDSVQNPAICFGNEKKKWAEKKMERGRGGGGGVMMRMQYVHPLSHTHVICCEYF